MTDHTDPLDGAVSAPPLREQLAPYLAYGDAELAVALLSFQQRFRSGLPTLNADDAPAFACRAQPANVGLDYHCPNCETSVRGVSLPGETPRTCPLCGDHPGMLALGRGPE